MKVNKPREFIASITIPKELLKELLQTENNIQKMPIALRRKSNRNGNYLGKYN